MNSAESVADLSKVDEIVEAYSGEKSALMAILQEIENLYGYIPAWTLKRISEKLNVPLIQVYGVASFYDAFHLTPRGKHVFRVCLGTACYLRGSAQTLEGLERELNITDGGTTLDLKFSLQSVHCVGACALAPVMILDNNYFGKMTPTKVRSILKRIQDKNED